MHTDERSSGMIRVYALEEPPSSYSKAIFLAGPTPRELSVPSWRPDALELLEAAGYDGVVFVPELRDGREHDWEGQVEWEERCLHLADCILFWVPRNFTTMLGLNTNDEWGTWKDSGKVVFGAPPEAERAGYQRYYADKLLVPRAETLEAIVGLALAMVGDGALRTDGEREVPLFIWRTKSFRQWYAALLLAGNRLDHARQVLAYRARRKKYVFVWVLHVDVYVAAEGRNKANEIVISRPDVAAVLLYKRAERLEDTLVVLVHEFRSSVSNAEGFVRELPGGSSFDESLAPIKVAVDEVREETGLSIQIERLSPHKHRQVAATLSAHHAHVFSVELTPDKLDWVQAQVTSGTVFGTDNVERTTLELVRVGDLLGRRADMVLQSPAQTIDWSTLGMILGTLHEIYA